VDWAGPLTRLDKLPKMHDFVLLKYFYVSYIWHTTLEQCSLDCAKILLIQAEIAVTTYVVIEPDHDHKHTRACSVIYECRSSGKHIL
jgi:hypothetical protein